MSRNIEQGKLLADINVPNVEVEGLEYLQNKTTNVDLREAYVENTVIPNVMEVTPAPVAEETTLTDQERMNLVSNQLREINRESIEPAAQRIVAANTSLIQQRYGDVAAEDYANNNK